MGVAPLQYADEMTTASLELDGSETFDIVGLRDAIETSSAVTLLIHRTDGTTQAASLICRIDTSYERSYMKQLAFIGVN